MKDSVTTFVSRKSFWGTGVIWMTILLLLDQSTKYLAYRFLRGSQGVELLKGCFRLQYLENEGAAFGMMQGKRGFFFFVTGLILFLIFYFLLKMPRTRNYIFLNRVCFLMLAGAVGNLIDRAVRGFVVDFLYISLIDFPIFNIADICAVSAAILFGFALLFRYGEEDLEFLRFRKGKGKR